MPKVPLGEVLIEQRETIGKVDGDNLPLIGVDNKIGLHLSRQSRLPNLSRYKLLKKGWFAYNPMRINVGSIGYADSEHKCGIVSPDYIVVSCSNLIHPEYFFHFIKSEIGLREIAKNTGGSVRERLYFDKLSNIEIELPGYSEQEKIVASLNKKRTLLNVLESECRLLEKDILSLKDCILRKAIQGKLVQQNQRDEPADKLLKKIKTEKQQVIADGQLKKEKQLPPITSEDIPFELPDGWLWCRLGEIVNLVSGVTLGKSYSEKLINVPYLRVANVQRGFVDTNKVKELHVPKSEIDKYALQKGDLVMIEGGDWDKVGRCAIWDGRINPCIHQNHIFRLRFYGNISSHWAELFLNSPIARKYFESCSKQTTNLASINKTQLSSTLFPLPSLSEQKRIVAKAQQLLQTVSLLEKQVEKNRMQAQYLLEAVLKDAYQLSYPTTTMAH